MPIKGSLASLVSWTKLIFASLTSWSKLIFAGGIVKVNSGHIERFPHFPYIDTATVIRITIPNTHIHKIMASHPYVK